MLTSNAGYVNSVFLIFIIFCWQHYIELSQLRIFSKTLFLISWAP